MRFTRNQAIRALEELEVPDPILALEDAHLDTFNLELVDDYFPRSTTFVYLRAQAVGRFPVSVKPINSGFGYGGVETFRKASGSTRSM